MPRRGNIAKRDVLPDPLYNSKLVTRLINSVMYDGKKGVAQKIVYGAFDIVKEKTGKDPLEAFEAGYGEYHACLGGKGPPCRWCHLSGPDGGPSGKTCRHWVCAGSHSVRQKSFRKNDERKTGRRNPGRHQRARAAHVKKREDTHKMAEANKAFAHYRW